MSRVRLAFLSAAFTAAIGCGPATDFGPHDGGGGADRPAKDLSGDVDLAGSDLALAGGDLAAGPTFGTACMNGPTVLTGTVFAPNGVDPVAAALVYVPFQVNAFTKGVGCDTCDKPIDPALTSTMTKPDGTFSLPLDSVPQAATVQVAAAKGRFRRISQVPVSCGPNIAPKIAMTLPGKSADGDIPKIAVGTGTLDHLDQVLVALGITEFTCLEGRKNTTSPASCTTTGKLSDLLASQNGLSIDDYNMVFIGCAPGAWANYSTNGVNTGALTTGIQTWTGKGGRLFVTDNSYDYLAAAFPQAVSWQGTQAMPWPVDGANVGVGGSSQMPAMMTANVDDANLAAWLKVVGVNTSPTVTISGILNNWSVQAAPEPMGTSQIVDGTASYTANGAKTMSDVPLTSEFTVNACGKVLYSSYHTLSTVNQNMLSAQEKILEYLMLDVAACTHM